MSDERFDVVQFFRDGSYEFVERDLDVKAAVERFRSLSWSLGAQVGTTVRVIITDGGDFTVAQWEFGKGVTWPSPEGTEAPR